MSGAGSLLAHLASRLTGRTETLATEALGYILDRSVATRRALRAMVSEGVYDVGEIVSARTEVAGDENERVDLVGFDADGDERVLVEAKFWAGLTDHQPRTYLARLAAGDRVEKPSVLLFVAPERRLETLWTELRRRVPDGTFEEGPAVPAAPKHSARLKGGPHRLMLTSWRSLLRGMASRATEDGDTAAERDLAQLLALCEREDEDAFLPLRSDEFGPEIPRRLRNLRRLVDEATTEARKKGFAQTEGPQGDSTGLRLWSFHQARKREIRVGGGMVRSPLQKVGDRAGHAHLAPLH